MGEKKRKGHLSRIQGKDYSGSGYYFVTFKTTGSIIPLSTIHDSEAFLNDRGNIVFDAWKKLPDQFQNLFLDEIVIMPDHVHAVVRLLGFETLAPEINRSFTPLMQNPRPVLGKMVRAWKAASTRAIRQSGWPLFQWQSRYHDMIIRNEHQLNRVREYIKANPKAWEQKQLLKTKL